MKYGHFQLFLHYFKPKVKWWWCSAVSCQLWTHMHVLRELVTTIQGALFIDLKVAHVCGSICHKTFFRVSCLNFFLVELANSLHTWMASNCSWWLVNSSACTTGKSKNLILEKQPPLPDFFHRNVFLFSIESNTCRMCTLEFCRIVNSNVHWEIFNNCPQHLSRCRTKLKAESYAYIILHSSSSWFRENVKNCPQSLKSLQVWKVLNTGNTTTDWCLFAYRQLLCSVTYLF